MTTLLSGLLCGCARAEIRKRMAEQLAAPFPSYRKSMSSKRILLQNEKVLPPQEPSPEECCQNGCVVCVWDTYAKAVQQYELLAESRKAIIGESDHNSHDVADKVTSVARTESASPEVVGMNAFQQLEARLAKQRDLGHEEKSQQRDSNERTKAATSPM